MAELEKGLRGTPHVSAGEAGRMEETGRQKWPPDQEGGSEEVEGHKEQGKGLDATLSRVGCPD